MDECEMKFKIYCSLLSSGIIYDREVLIIETSNRYADFKQAWADNNPPKSDGEQSDNAQQLKAEIAKILSNATKMARLAGYITVAFDETSYQRLEQLSAN